MTKQTDAINKAIEALESSVNLNRQQFPDFTFGPPCVFGNADVLDEFASFLLKSEGVKGDEFKRCKLTQLSAKSDDLETVWIYLSKFGPILVGAFIAFLRSKKCSIKMKGKDSEGRGFLLEATAPTEEQLTRLLKTGADIYIHQIKRKSKRKK